MPNHTAFLPPPVFNIDPKETLELVRTFCRIADPTLRAVAIRQVEAIAARADPADGDSKPGPAPTH